MPKVLALFVAGLIILMASLLFLYTPKDSSEVAAWFSGAGSFAAAAVALYIAAKSHERERSDADALAGLTATRMWLDVADASIKLSSLSAIIDFSDPPTRSETQAVEAYIHQLDQILKVLPLTDLRYLVPLPDPCAYRLVQGLAGLSVEIRNVREMLQSDVWDRITSEARSALAKGWQSSFDEAHRYISAAAKQLQAEARRRAPRPIDDEKWL